MNRIDRSADIIADAKLSRGPSALDYFEQRNDQIVSTIRKLVEIESPSDNKAAADRVAEAVAQDFAALGGEIRVHRAVDFGNHLQVDFQGKAGGKPVLLLGHYDTVYPLGTHCEDALPNRRQQTDGTGRARHEVGYCADAACHRRPAGMGEEPWASAVAASSHRAASFR